MNKVNVLVDRARGLGKLLTGSETLSDTNIALCNADAGNHDGAEFRDASGRIFQNSVRWAGGK